MNAKTLETVTFTTSKAYEKAIKALKQIDYLPALKNTIESKSTQILESLKAIRITTGVGHSASDFHSKGNSTTSSRTSTSAIGSMNAFGLGFGGGVSQSRGTSDFSSQGSALTQMESYSQTISDVALSLCNKIRFNWGFDTACIEVVKYIDILDSDDNIYMTLKVKGSNYFQIVSSLVQEYTAQRRFSSCNLYDIAEQNNVVARFKYEKEQLAVKEAKETADRNKRRNEISGNIRRIQDELDDTNNTIRKLQLCELKDSVGKTLIIIAVMLLILGAIFQTGWASCTSYSLGVTGIVFAGIGIVMLVVGTIIAGLYKNQMACLSHLKGRKAKLEMELKSLRKKINDLK